MAASRLVWRVLAVGLMTGVMGASVHGQQPPADAKDDESLNKIREAINRPALVITGGPSLFEPGTHDQWHVGVLTFLPPDTAGEFLRVQVPIGALVMKPVRAIRKAQHDRAERLAHEEVLHALADFQSGLAR
jgi:hypothetical protein